MWIVKKFNKRIVVQCDELSYYAPNFIRNRIPSREEYQKIADRLNAGEKYIDVIIEFESRFNPRNK